MLRTNWQAAAGAGWQQQLETLHQKTGLRVRGWRRAGPSPAGSQAEASTPAKLPNFSLVARWRAAAGAGPCRRQPHKYAAGARTRTRTEATEDGGQGWRQRGRAVLASTAATGGSDPSSTASLSLLEQTSSAAPQPPHTPASKLYKVPQPCDHLQPNFVEVETQSFCQKITFLSAYSLSYELWSIVENF